MDNSTILLWKAKFSRWGRTYYHFLKVNLRFYCTPTTFGYLCALSMLIMMQMHLAHGSLYYSPPLDIFLKISAVYFVLNLLAGVFVVPIILAFTSKNSLVFIAFLVLPVIMTAGSAIISSVAFVWTPNLLSSTQMFHMLFAGPLFGTIGVWVFFYFKTKDVYAVALSEIVQDLSEKQVSFGKNLKQTKIGSIERVEDISMLSASKNYTIVTTRSGEHIIRMPFTQAVSEISSKGVQIHRSHWVSASELKRLFYENGNPKLETHLGKVLPVSRKAISIVRESLGESES